MKIVNGVFGVFIYELLEKITRKADNLAMLPKLWSISEYVNKIKQAINDKCKKTIIPENMPLEDWGEAIFPAIIGQDLFNVTGRREYITQLSSITWTVPEGVYYARIIAVGAGGGGGGGASSGHFSSGDSNYFGSGGGGGGGAGGIAFDQLAVQPGDVITITAGAGGVGAAARTGLATNNSSSNVFSGYNGNTGGTTTVKLNGVIVLQANGGSGGLGGSGFYGTTYSYGYFSTGGDGGSGGTKAVGAYGRKGEYGSAGGTGSNNDAYGGGVNVYAARSGSTGAVPSSSYKIYNGFKWKNNSYGNGGMGTNGRTCSTSSIAESESGDSGVVIILY